MENKFYVYVYFDPSRNMEEIYVGKGKDDRATYHLNRTDKHPFVHRLKKMAQLGIKPIIEKYDGLDELEAYDLEAKLIDAIGKKIDGTGPLLNIKDGGNRGALAESTKRKMSEAHRGKKLSEEHKAKVSAGCKGRKMSEEHKAKVSERHKGKKISDAHKEYISTHLKGNQHRKGATFTDEQRKKISDALSNKPERCCIYCGKIGRGSGMTRFHFDNCKYKNCK